MKYSNDTDLEITIRQLRYSIPNTTIEIPFYDSAYFPTDVHEKIKNSIVFFIIVYAVTVVTYFGAYFKNAIDSHASFTFSATHS